MTKTRMKERHDVKAGAYQLLREFAETFAEENAGEWWGHDTNLGECDAEFERAFKKIMVLATEYRLQGVRRIKLNGSLSAQGKHSTVNTLKRELDEFTV